MKCILCRDTAEPAWLLRTRKWKGGSTSRNSKAPTIDRFFGIHIGPDGMQSGTLCWSCWVPASLFLDKVRSQYRNTKPIDLKWFRRLSDAMDTDSMVDLACAWAITSRLDIESKAAS